ncbi:MAG: aminoglycoside phosphotransferase family protein [Clostridia bacterium]|nr:aminoglycoside phosphotransferase family protein [Clostridia bacterium]
MKIFAPEQSQIGGEAEFAAETYGLRRAEELGVPAPRILASGTVHDRCVFRWLLERIAGHPPRADGDADWETLGRQLRTHVERLDTPCAPFDDRPLRRPLAEARWELFSETFRREREAFLERWHPEHVFVHGDLNADNLLVTPEGKLYLIDFADCRRAPVETELAALVCDGFALPPQWNRGFLGEEDPQRTAASLVAGLLLHDYGAWIIRDRVAPPQNLHTLGELAEHLLRCLKRKK